MESFGGGGARDPINHRHCASELPIGADGLGLSALRHHSDKFLRQVAHLSTLAATPAFEPNLHQLNIFKEST